MIESAAVITATVALTNMPAASSSNAAGPSSQAAGPNGKSAGGGGAPRLKLVIRRLPPTLPEEIFWKSCSQWITDETCSWRRYVQGRKPDE